MHLGLLFLYLSTTLIYNYVSCTKPHKIYYVEDHQTIMDAQISFEESHNIERKVRMMLDLPKQPKLVKNSLENSAPRFFLDLYKSLSSDEVEDNEIRSKRSIGLEFEEERWRDIFDSDVVLSLDVARVTTVRNRKGRVFWIDGKRAARFGELLGAVFRMYKFPGQTFENKDQGYIIKTFRISKTFKGKHKFQYVSSLKITQDQTGWLTLNLTSSFRKLIDKPKLLLGIYVSVFSIPSFEERTLADAGLTEDQKDELKPFAVAFFKADNQVNIRKIRASNLKSTNPQFRRVVESYNPEAKLRRGCRMQGLYVSFKDLQWQDWIIAPEGYSAYYCQGQCTFPLNNQMNATNHAIVQTLVHIMNPNRFPTACCAPTKLSPLSVLYFLDDWNVILKKYRRMVVKSCGCH